MVKSHHDRVLVIAETEDAAADLVVDALSAHPVDVVRFDTADFPQRLRLVASLGSAAGPGWLHAAGARIDLDAVRSIYRRSPTFFDFPNGMSAPEHRFASAEAVQGFGGVLAGVRCRWVNHPGRVADAEYKPAQLQLAAECGLRVPRTLITNSSADAAEFAFGVGGQIIYKPLSPGVVSEENKVRVINATRLAAEEVKCPAVGLTAHLFQEWLPKVFDVRLTVVGTHCFGAAIHTDNALSHVDWRADYDALTYTNIDPPGSVRAGVRSYLDAFGLLFGAFDFSVTQDGEWWFLECNPNGAWAWIEDRIGLPIAGALAGLLAREDDG